MTSRKGRRTSRLWILGLVICVGIVCHGSRSLYAQFQTPVSLSSNPLDPPRVGEWSMGIDHFGSVIVAAVEEGNIVLHSLNGARQTTLTIPSSAAVPAADAPALAFTALRTYIAFTDDHDGGAAETRDVFLASKFATILSSTENMSRHDGDDRHPAMAIDFRGNPVLAWTHRADSSEAEIVILSQSAIASGGEPIAIGHGDRARIAADSDGIFHLLHAGTGGDLVYRTFRLAEASIDADPPRVIANQSGLAEPFHELRVCNGNEMIIAYSEDDRLLVVPGVDGVLADPLEVVTGEFRSPHIMCNSRGVLAIAWERGGDVWYRVGGVRLLLPAEIALTTPEVEEDPRIAVDSSLNLHLTFRRDDRLFVTTNAPAPEAGFLAEPTEGEAPLHIQFTDRSEGDIFRWHWKFGDGGTSGSQSPVHVYDEPGLYSVTLAVEGPGGRNTFRGEQKIRVIDASNTMTLADRRVFPGQQNLWVPLTISHAKPLQAFQIALSFDPEALELVGIDIDDKTNLAQVAPELIIHNFSAGDDGRAVVATAVIIDFEEPRDGRTFTPGVDQRIGNFIFNVSPNNVFNSETVVRLENQIGNPPVNNIFISNGQSTLPQLESAQIRIEEPAFPPPRYFIRGDSDANLRVNITDVILTLTFLFLEKQSPGCMDAADVNDDGSVDISDAVYLLQHLFQGGSYPPPPYPDLGLDPTEDDPFADCGL